MGKHSVPAIMNGNIFCFFSRKAINGISIITTSSPFKPNNRPMVPSLKLHSLLLSHGHKCLNEKQYQFALRAYDLIKDSDKLNKVGEEFMKIGLLSNALKAFEAASNKMMVDFIKENFGERDLATRVYV